MASPSKEENILRLILENSPLREWRFEEVVREAGVTSAVANKWLKKYVAEGVIRRVKTSGAFPFYTAGRDNPVYLARKRAFAFERLVASGLLAGLLGLKEVRTIIVFGSMIRGDWYKDSDVDVFLYGKPGKFDEKAYEDALQHPVELHVFETLRDLRDVKTGLGKNVADGYLVKGTFRDLDQR